MRRAVGVLAALVMVACAQEGPTPRNAPPRQPGADEPPTRSTPHQTTAQQVSRPLDASPSAPASTPLPSTASQTSPIGETLLYNSGANLNDPRVNIRVGRAEAQKVINTLYPSHLSQRSQCPTNISSLAQARARGYFVPQVESAADGSFTAAGMKERLYLVWIGECGATHAENYGSDELVVLRSGKVVDRISISGSSSIDRVVDVDGDGRDELILGGGFTGQGETVEMVRLVRLGSGSLWTIRSFGQVLDDDCGSLLAHKQVKYSLIWVTHTPEGAPRFRVEKKVRPCK